MIPPPEDHLGYQLSGTSREHEPGYPTLEIWLSEQPSEAHFDPEQIQLAIWDDQHLDTISIEHPWSGDHVLQLAPGEVILMDRKEKHMDGFIFGGSLTIDVQDDHTYLRLSSEAPIMLRNIQQPEVAVLIEEASILLARRRAFYAEQPEVLEVKLGRLKPLQLYAAFLLSIQAIFDELPASDDEVALKAQHIVHAELVALSNLLPGFELPLEALC
jgi:hypothetical protein